MRKMIAAAATLGFLATIFAGGAALGYGGHGGGGGGHGGGGGWHGGGGHGGGWHGGGWHGGYGCCGYGWGIGLYGWPYGYGYYGGYYDDPSDYYGDDYGAYSNDGPPPGMQAPAGYGPQQSNWYYCDASKSYYPYVKTCAHAWQPVPASPQPQPPG
jgi:hypothetical protein